MKARKYLFSFVSLFCALVFVRETSAQNYCVITFAEKLPNNTWPLFQKPIEPLLREYHWIIPQDSLSRTTSSPTPIYPFVVDTNNHYPEYGWHSYYWLDMMHFPTQWRTKQYNNYFSEDYYLLSLIYNNRRKIQEYSYTQIDPRNGKKIKRKVTVYVTPIKGECNNVVSCYDGRTVYYSKDFQYQEGFYNTEELFNKLLLLVYMYLPFRGEQTKNYLSFEIGREMKSID